MAEKRDDAAQAVRPMSPEEIRLADQAMQNQIQADVIERDPMNGPEGGEYIVNGEKVDCNGEPIKAKKKD
jgi:hypothetical protein